MALDTAASLIAALAALLMMGRFRRHGQPIELVLAGSLGLLAAGNLVPLSALMIAGSAPDTLATSLSATNRLLGAALFAAAAFLPGHRPRHAWWAAEFAIPLITVVLAADLAAALAGWPPTERPGAGGASSLWAAVGRNPSLLGIQLAAAGLYAAAAAGFLRRAERQRDDFYGWLAMAAVLAAASHVNYFLHPLPHSQWAYSGDGFRIACYAVLFTGSMREIQSYWRALSQAAVTQERRRIARELHDGVSQELAYLSRNLGSLTDEDKAAAGRIARLRQAAERAQAESRRAISTLAARTDQPVDLALAQAARDIAERFHIPLDLMLAEGLRLPDARVEALVRIACEAIANAGRHSGASRIDLRLDRDGQRVRLGVSDDGHGFDTAAPRAGFGLISMTERARSVGGQLWISSAPGQGCRVEAIL